MIETIVYHGDCPDGWCGAFVAQQTFPDALLLPLMYGIPVDEESIRGKHVLVVDFSWKRAETERLYALAASMQILDHHLSAEIELRGLYYALFDMNRSGAQLAWDWACAKGEYGERPWYVDYVADRDLWRWQLPNSKTINAYLMTLPHTVEAWSKLNTLSLSAAGDAGLGARAQIDAYVKNVVAHAYPGRWNGSRLSIVNAAYPSISDVGNALCEAGAEIGVGWFVRGDGLMQFSLRSIGDLDVSVLARLHGGGGHKNAAGFQVPLDQGLTILSGWTA